MRLIRLKVYSALDDSVIRLIKFNEQGLSLIVDETNSKTSGSNIGKTTAVKVIDLCLGANAVSSIYKEGDTGENHIIREFIEKNKVVAELEVEVDEQKFYFTRALYKNGKNEINGSKVKNITEYRYILNKIIFDNPDNNPSFRQLISKFVRLDNSNESSLLKYLGTYTKNYEYQAIYHYLYGLDISKSQNVNILTLNERIDKDIEAIFRKNGISSLDEFSIQIELMREELDKFKKAYAEVSVIEDYQEKKLQMDNLLVLIKQLESKAAKEKLNVNLMKEKIQREKDKMFYVDERILQNLYEETKGVVGELILDFKDLQTFHNGMLSKRLEILLRALKQKEDLLSQINLELETLQRSYEEGYVTFSCELKEKFEEKYAEFAVNKVKYENALNDYDYILKMEQEKQNNLKNKVFVDNDSSKQEDIKNALNTYFKNYTETIIGEPYALVFNEDDEEFPIKIIGLNGKPGTGIKKAMITCFDLAHINLILQKNYHMPVFEIHDKMENIDLVELKNIIEVARVFQGQYIFPVLNDRIETLGIKEDEVILRLSSTDKFFGV